MGYFNTTIKIPIAASSQATAFADGDLLADWQAIQIPRGSASLKSLTALVRPKGDAGPTSNSFALDILFSKTNTVSLGTVNQKIAHRPNNDIIGLIEIDASNYGTGHLQSTAVAMIGSDTTAAAPPMVITGDVTTGDNVGYDTIYVGLIARAAFDFVSINTVNEASFSAGTQTLITMDDGSGGTTMDCREHFAAGDILHAADDAVLGTVESTAAHSITLTAANTGDIAENDVIYNLHPIRLVLGFQK